MRVAYADPPYIGMARRHYGDEALCAEVDHGDLIRQLVTFDAWALSLSSPTLKQILALCPDGVRVGAWVKPFASFKPNVNPAYAWEPVIFSGGRKRGRNVPTVRDWCSVPITIKRGLAGVKPDEFSWWIFDLLGMEPEDEFFDLFPGSGAVSAAWDAYRRALHAFPLFAPLAD
jgi:hypothetical protein